MTFDPMSWSEKGEVIGVAEGVGWVRGLPGVGCEELVEIGDTRAMAFTLHADRIGVVMLDHAQTVSAGDSVRRTGRVLDVPVGEPLLGRVVDALGRPLDGGGPVSGELRLPIERAAPEVLSRTAVNVPLHTGIKAIDALIPIGRGQRELIVGDRQTGKTAIALAAMVAQDIPCVYCAIGQRHQNVGQVLQRLRDRGAMAHTCVVVAAPDDPPGLQFAAPYAATTIAEFFMERGQDVLIVYDDLTRHAQAYRTLSLLLRRPPGREAYPGDIFYLHSRLLERATHRLAGGSLTALPIVELEGGDMAAYIPTNLISITDGQIVLSPDLFGKGVLPAIDVAESVSRIGGDAQPAAWRGIAGALRIAYAAFLELEAFSRFDTRQSVATRESIRRGRRLREALKQGESESLPAATQIGLFLAALNGLLDAVPLARVPDAERAIGRAMADLDVSQPVTASLLETLQTACRPWQDQTDV